MVAEKWWLREDSQIRCKRRVVELNGGRNQTQGVKRSEKAPPFRRKTCRNPVKGEREVGRVLAQSSSYRRGRIASGHWGAMALAVGSGSAAAVVALTGSCLHDRERGMLGRGDREGWGKKKQKVSF